MDEIYVNRNGFYFKVLQYFMESKFKNLPSGARKEYGVEYPNFM